MIDIPLRRLNPFFNVEVSVLILNMKWYHMCELKVIRKNFSRYQYLFSLTGVVQQQNTICTPDNPLKF